MTQTMTGGEAIVDALLRHGVRHMYGIPGVQLSLIHISEPTRPY